MALIDYTTKLDYVSRTSQQQRNMRPSTIIERNGSQVLGGLHDTRSPVRGSPNVGIISAMELREIRNKTEKGIQKDAIILKREDLDSIKRNMIYKSPDQLLKDKKMRQSQMQETMKVSKMKRERMARLDEQRQNNAPPSSLSLEQQQRKQGLLSKAQMQLDEQLDDVKKMNELVLQSKVVTIRDKQIKENKQLEQEYLEEQKKLDLLMEIERLKSLKEEDERDERRQAAAYQSKRVLVEQIQERALIRQKEAEIIDRERIALKQQIYKIEEEEVKIATAKRHKLKVIQFEIENANQLALSMKAEKKQREIEEDQAIFRHVQAKQQAEMERQEMDRRVREDKERDVQKLRDLQEKAADRQADIDALRARRAYEQNEREYRIKQKLEHDKKQRLLADLEASRKIQFMERQKALQSQALDEREEFLKIINTQKDSEMKDRRVDDQRKAAFRNYSSDLKTQMLGNSNNKKQGRNDHLEEGRKLRVGQADEILKLETIKINKLNSLSGLGIESKYLSALSRKPLNISDKLTATK